MRAFSKTNCPPLPHCCLYLVFKWFVLYLRTLMEIARKTVQDRKLNWAVGWRWQFSRTVPAETTVHRDHGTVVLGSEALRHRRRIFSGEENMATKSLRHMGFKTIWEVGKKRSSDLQWAFIYLLIVSIKTCISAANGIYIEEGSTSWETVHGQKEKAAQPQKGLSSGRIQA